jgi:hypothetical protein
MNKTNYSLEDLQNPEHAKKVAENMQNARASKAEVHLCDERGEVLRRAMIETPFPFVIGYDGECYYRVSFTQIYKRCNQLFLTESDFIK